MMEKVSYLALRRLTEQAWDEEDQERLMVLSAAVDNAMLQQMVEEQAGML